MTTTAQEIANLYATRRERAIDAAAEPKMQVIDAGLLHLCRHANWESEMTGAWTRFEILTGDEIVTADNSRLQFCADVAAKMLGRYKERGFGAELEGRDNRFYLYLKF